MNITKKVTFIAKEGHTPQLKTLLESMVTASRQEEGCLHYSIYQFEKEMARFVVVETWENEEALNGHKHSKHYIHYKSNYEVHVKDKSSDELLPIGEDNF